MRFEQYLNTGIYIDSDHELVINYALNKTNGVTSREDKLNALYYAVRDDFYYDPYRLQLNEHAIKASHLLTRDYGYCIEKSCLFAACARVIGVPSRMGFANVRNHIGTSRLEQLLKTDLLVFHGYAEVWINDRWVKTTPVFNKALCYKLDVEPLDFDCRNDAVFQQYDRKGSRFMEYLYDYGTFEDVPFKLFISELIKHYPHLKDRILDQEKISL